MEEMTLPWGDGEKGEGEGPAGDGEAARTILTVSEVNRMAKRRLESLSVEVQGEVSGVKTGYGYYVYFDLRDREAALPAILPRRQYDALDFPLVEGSLVLVAGKLSIYEKQGRYQIRVSRVSPYGEGEIQRRVEALKRKLHAEGLFDDSRKADLPAFPSRIGVVSSPRGAAIRDVLVTIRRRFPPAGCYVRGVKVQGEGAERQICEALEFFESEYEVDLVILARGGGSIQDLEPFNSEAVARTIAGMSVPVVCGVGHEPDVTISDLVADHRASTPTGAAEAAVPDRCSVTEYLGGAAASMARHVAGEVRSEARRLAALRRSPLYRNPYALLGRFMERWERAASDLPASPARGLRRNRERLSAVLSRPVFTRGRELTYRDAMRLEKSAGRLLEAGPRFIERKSMDLKRVEASLKALSPLAVLKRGYSITFASDTGRVVRASEEVETGSRLKIRLGRGGLDAEVTGKE